MTKKTTSLPADDYSLSKLKKIKVRDLVYYVMPRYLEHYVARDYEAFSADLFVRYLKPNATVVDIGAHYGFYSLLAARAVGRSGKVYAFEPVPTNHAVLNKNIKANHFANIKAEGKAISDQTGTTDFNIPWASDSASFYEHPQATTIKKIEIQRTTIDDYFRSKTVDFLKIDTEGHEIEVLQGATKTIKRNPQLRLLVELNPSCLQAANHSPLELLRLITSLGFEIYIINEDFRRLHRITDRPEVWEGYIGERGYANLFCLPKASSVSLMMISHTANQGGAEDALLELIDGLQARDGVCHLVLPHHGPMEKALKDRAVSYEIIPFLSWARSETILPAHLGNEDDQNMAAVSKMVTLVDSFDPHFVFSNTIVVPWGAVVASISQKPHVWMIHEFGDIDHKLHFDYNYQEVLSIINNLSDLVITNSKSVTKHLASIVERSKICQVYYAMSIDKAKSKGKLPKTVFRHPRSLRLVLVGRVTETKGQLEAVKAIQLLAKEGLNLELVMVGAIGSAHYLKRLEAEIARAGLKSRVRILGHQDNPFAYIKAADALLMCSKNEAFGRVTVEAMLLKKPIIGSAAGGTTELVRNGHNGYLYRVGDYQDLAGKIKRIYRRPRLLKKMGAAGLRYARDQFNDDGYSGKIHSALRRVLKNPERPKRFFFEKFLQRLNLLQEDRDHLRQANARYQEEIAELRKKLDRIYHSRSWRATAPIRRLRRRLTKKTKP